LLKQKDIFFLGKIFHCLLHHSCFSLHGRRNCSRSSHRQQANDDDGQSDSGAKSTALATSSSPTLAATKMVDRKVLEMSDFFKKTVVIEEDHLAYHRFGWLTGNLLSTIPEVDVPTIHDAGWGLRPLPACFGISILRSNTPRLSLYRHRSQQYIDATFKSS
jgi:hypothetical protein